MTVKTKTYKTRTSMNVDKKLMLQQNFRSLHTDYVENGFEVIYDDSPDIIDDKLIRMKQLKSKLISDSLSFGELKELMRLERGLPIKSGLLQRIRSFLGL